ncbi:MAG: hypothetical protein K2Y26_04575 [Gemmatimonadaceae bacterium]|jgi:hypothetical protein|nr:hypothetical protein [Gemmatimonadaceae bacterium]MBX9854772.1 hypothetical protein [Gemmatimonadaceae bacterium]
MPHSTTIAHSTPVTITGTWEGALYSAHGQQARHFVLYQPARGAQSTLSAGPLGNCGITLVVDDSEPEPLQLLDGTTRVLVALAERAQLLIEARLRGDNMVGHWVQRDGDGRVQGEGELVAGRV